MINHPPFITIFVGGINHQKWVVPMTLLYPHYSLVIQPYLMGKPFMTLPYLHQSHVPTGPAAGFTAADTDHCAWAKSRLRATRWKPKGRGIHGIWVNYHNLNQRPKPIDDG